MKIFRQNFSETRAFTLLEVLIAVAIFAIVLAAINTVLYGAVRLRNKTTEALEISLPIEQAMTTIKRDLANIVAPSGTLSGALQTSSISNALPGQIGPNFYTATGWIDGNNPWGDIQKISYLLAAPTNQIAGKDFLRIVTRNLLATTPELLTPQHLLSGVQTVVFSFYDGAQWADTWDSTTQTNLPLAIKMQIQFAQTDVRAPAQNAMELVVPIDAQMRTNTP